MNRNAHWIKADGTEGVDIFTRKIQIEDIWKYLDGGWAEHLEVVHNGTTQHMYMDEEGLMKQLPLNKKATEIAERRIVGDVVIIDRL